MKLGPVTKSDKRNKTTSKNFGDDVMSGNDADFSKIKEVYALKGIFSETTCKCILTCQI